MDTPRESHDLKYTVQQKPWLYYVEKRKEIYRAVAVSAFSMIQFSPKGLTTKTDVFIVNFWPLPGFFL